MDTESNREAITSSPVSISSSNSHAFAASEGANVPSVEPGAKSDALSVEPMAAREAVTGLKLAVVIASAALACFLMLIDTMVISTVGYTLPQGVIMYVHDHRENQTDRCFPIEGNSSHYRRIWLATRYWLVCQRVSVRKVSSLVA